MEAPVILLGPCCVCLVRSSCAPLVNAFTGTFNADELPMPDQVHTSSYPVHRRVVFGITCLAVLAAIPVPLVQASSLRRSAIVVAVERAQDAVVNIHGRKTLDGQRVEMGVPNASRQVNGMGTGVIIDPRGYIITNYHVVEGVAQIQVTLSDRRTVVGKLVANDIKTDLAIIKIDADEPLAVIPIGTSSDLMPGETVIAIGNAYGYEHTITRGIISALHRPVEVSDRQNYVDLIQTDAPINPGNSGGPLLNIDGDMIGMNVAVRVGAQGIAFAVPVDQVLTIASQLLDEKIQQRVQHGISGESRFRDGKPHFVVTDVDSGSPADQCGLQPGDVITAVEDTSVYNVLDFYRALLDRRPDDQVRLEIIRDGNASELELVLGQPRNGGPSLEKRMWALIGLRLSPISSTSFNRLNTRYRGGLRVLAVRPNSPAAQQGIRPGDILVGMHKWETVSMDNVAYILDSPEFRETQPSKFYIVRGTETLYGHLQVSF